MLKRNSRRHFLTLGFSDARDQIMPADNGKSKMIKMLTQDGKLVEVSNSVIIESSIRKSATNVEIMNWVNKD